MPRIAPDIPELQHVPYTARSIVYMRATNRAIRSPLTWLIAAIVLGVGIGLCANQGSALYGRSGGVFGVFLGTSVATWAFFKVVLPLRTRLLVPSVIDETAGGGDQPNVSGPTGPDRRP